VSETSIQGQIKKLVEIQKLDSEIYDFKRQLEEKPIIIKELKEAFEKSQGRLKELEEQLKGVQLARKEKELELKSKEELIIKANQQLSQIKTNKEYSAKISEIENIKADQSVMEEKILASYDESDKVNSEIEKEKTVVAEKEKTFLDQKKEIEAQVKEIEDRIKVLRSQRERITPEIDNNFLRRYEKVLGHKEGLAIAAVRGNACGGCYMNLSPQVLNMIKMHDRIIECETCQRILYIEEDL